MACGFFSFGCFIFSDYSTSFWSFPLVTNPITILGGALCTWYLCMHVWFSPLSGIPSDVYPPIGLLRLLCLHLKHFLAVFSATKLPLELILDLNDLTNKEYHKLRQILCDQLQCHFFLFSSQYIQINEEDYCTLLTAMMNQASSSDVHNNP